MTVRIQRVWPRGLEPYTQLSIIDRQAALVTRTDGGVEVGISLQEWPLREFVIDTLFLDEADSSLRDRLTAFLHEIGIQARTFWITEPETRQRAGLIGLGDGVRNAWALPVDGDAPADLLVMVDGEPVDVTVHGKANLLSDDDTACALSGIGNTQPTATSGETVDRITGLGVVGGTCFRCTFPGGAVPGGGVNAGDVNDMSTAVVVTPGATYTGIGALAWGDSGNTIKAIIRWFDSGGNASSEKGASVATETTTAGWKWYLGSVTDIAPSDAAYAIVSVDIGETSDTDRYADVLSLAPGSLPEWWAPSTAPPVVELATPPASGSLVTYRATARHMARVRFDRPEFQRSLDEVGNSIVRSLRMHEVQPW